MHRKQIYIILFILTIATQLHAQKAISGYSHYEISGFNVLVEKNALIHDKTLTSKAMKLLKEKLIKISNLNIAQTKIDTLKAVPIFVDWETTNGGAQYHPSKTWLERNGYAVEKAQCVEISNIKHFVGWSNQNQPEMVLHELAHAYHQRIDNSLKSIISQAYQNAVSSNLYTSVPYHQGGGEKTTSDRAYAMNNEKEYFAELTEAYFGINDYFPFDKKELEEYDPIGYTMMMAVWGALREDK